MDFKSSAILIIFLIASSSSSFKQDYELLLTYKKYLIVRQAAPPAEQLSLVYILQTTNQRCLKKLLSIYDPGNIPDCEVERKQFSMSRVIFGKSRDMMEAYAVMLAAPLCNSYVDEYFNKMFVEVLKILKNEKYEENLECFENFKVRKLKNLESFLTGTSEEECTEITGVFTKHYVLNSIDYVRNLIAEHGYPPCIEDVAIKNAIYFYKAVVYANTDPIDFNYYIVKRDYVDMMKNSNNDALDCILKGLKRMKIRDLVEYKVLQSNTVLNDSE